MTKGLKKLKKPKFRQKFKNLTMYTYLYVIELLICNRAVSVI